jgi:hypothetical protein
VQQLEKEAQIHKLQLLEFENQVLVWTELIYFIYS